MVSVFYNFFCIDRVWAQFKKACPTNATMVKREGCTTLLSMLWALLWTRRLSKYIFSSQPAYRCALSPTSLCHLDISCLHWPFRWGTENILLKPSQFIFNCLGSCQRKHFVRVCRMWTCSHSNPKLIQKREIFLVLILLWEQEYKHRVAISSQSMALCSAESKMKNLTLTFGIFFLGARFSPRE